MEASSHLLFLLNLCQRDLYHCPVLDDLRLLILLLLGGLKLLIMSEVAFLNVRTTGALLQLLRTHTTRSQLVRLVIVSPYHFQSLLSCDFLRQELNVELSILMIPSQAINMLPEADSLAQRSLPYYGLGVCATFDFFFIFHKNWQLHWRRFGLLNAGGGVLNFLHFRSPRFSRGGRLGRGELCSHDHLLLQALPR